MVFTRQKTGYLKPPGEWNKQTIIAIEDHIMVILNGAVIVDAFLDDLTPLAKPESTEHKSPQRTYPSCGS